MAILSKAQQRKLDSADHHLAAASNVLGQVATSLYLTRPGDADASQLAQQLAALAHQVDLVRLDAYLAWAK
jgi:hypothetical protein